MLEKTEIYLRDLEIKDLDSYIENHHPENEFHKFNGPYFKKPTLESLEEDREILRKKITDGDESYKSRKLIVDKKTEVLIGQVNWYWKSKETNWLEVGIVIYNKDYWSRGVGFLALKSWISEVFETKKEIVRLGLTTWSGNRRMMALAQKVGLKTEAVYRKARIVDGEYYDSVSYGILREEWAELIK